MNGDCFFSFNYVNLGLTGIWLGILIANITAGIAAQLWFQNTLRNAERLHLFNNNLKGSSTLDQYLKD